MHYNIALREMVKVVVALKIWGHLWANKHVEIFCDDRSVVDVFFSFGKARDPILATCARNVWLLSTMHNTTVVVSHVKDSQNTVADLLSRWLGTKEDYSKLHHLGGVPYFVDKHIDLTFLNHDI